MCRGVNPERIESQKYADNCPAGSRFKYESYFASGRHEIIKALTADPPDIDITEKLIHIAFSCTSCGNCQVNCNPIKDLEPMNAAMALKQYLVEKGHAPLKSHNALIQSIVNYDNPWMSPRSARGKWAKKQDIKDLNKETLF